MRRLQRYLQQSWAELDKVVWPNRQTATQLTIAVIAFSLTVAILVGALDYVFTKALQALISRG